MRELIKSPFSSLVCAAVAAVGLAVAPAPAGAQTIEELTVVGRLGPDGEARSLSQAVSFSDLDLRHKAGRDELSRRINDTARGLCEQLGESSTASGVVPSCRDGAVRDAMSQARRAYALAESGAYETARAATAEAVPASDIVAAPAETYVAQPTVTLSTVTNGPVADTPENRGRYGGPMSNAGRRTAPVGN